MTDVFNTGHEEEIHEVDSHEDELTEAELDELEALGAAEDADLILGEIDA